MIHTSDAIAALLAVAAGLLFMAIGASPAVRARIGAIARRINFGEISLDLVAIAGAALISYGARLVYPPAGFIVAGIFLLVGWWLSARSREG